MTSDLVHVGRAKAAPKEETIGAEETSAAPPVETPAPAAEPSPPPAPPVEVSPALASPGASPKKKIFKKKKKLPAPPPKIGLLDKVRSFFSVGKAPQKPQEQRIGAKAPPDQKKGIKTLVFIAIAAKLLEGK